MSVYCQNYVITGFYWPFFLPDLTWEEDVLTPWKAKDCKEGDIIFLNDGMNGEYAVLGIVESRAEQENRIFAIAPTGKELTKRRKKLEEWMKLSDIPIPVTNDQTIPKEKRVRFGTITIGHFH